MIIILFLTSNPVERHSDDNFKVGRRCDNCNHSISLFFAGNYLIKYFAGNYLIKYDFSYLFTNYDQCLEAFEIIS